jgi:hypothetical protein
VILFASEPSKGCHHAATEKARVNHGGPDREHRHWWEWRDIGAGIFRLGASFEKISDGVYLAGIGIVLMGPMVGIASIIRAVRGTRGRGADNNAPR